MTSVRSRKDRVHYAVCQSKLFQNSTQSVGAVGEHEVNFDDFWKFYVKYMDQLHGKKVSSNQRKGFNF